MKLLFPHAFILLLLGISACATERAPAPAGLAVAPRAGFLAGEELAVAIFDGRANQESSEAVKREIRASVSKAYPDARIVSLDDRQYFAESQPNRITLKVAIAAYGAGFGSKVTVGVGSISGQFAYGVVPEGTWNGLAGFVVTLYDKRPGANQKFSETISKLVSKPNMFGYATANNALREAYEAALQQLLFFVDRSLMG
jgi:hypothetical protein